jgi:hypothetical protein
VPHYLHTVAAAAAADAGKHVFVEKPMGVSPNDAKAIIDTCREKGMACGAPFVALRAGLPRGVSFDALRGHRRGDRFSTHLPYGTVLRFGNVWYNTQIASLTSMPHQRYAAVTALIRSPPHRR